MMTPMMKPLQITFHNVESSPALRDYVAQKVEKLERYSDRITSCRVAIEAPHQHHVHGNHWQINVELSVPGTELVVNRSPDKSASHTDPYAAIDVAFDEAQRQLKSWAQKTRGDVKRHEPI
jgi:ribosomal subunit interface protein